MGYTDNLVSLMVGKLTRLPAETQSVLQQLACVGNAADITTLATILGTSEDQVHAALWPSVRQELVERVAGAFRFVHDRIQEAAYSLIPEELRGETHLRIGRLLAAHTPPEKREETIFDIVNQFNRGTASISSPEEREQVAELNLIAGRRAKSSTAYASALSYLVAGRALLPEDCWERCHQLTFALELHRAECEFLTGELTASEVRIAELARRAGNTVPDLVAVTQLGLDLFMAVGRRDRAVQIGLEYLRRVGLEWSAHPTHEEVRQEYERMWRQIGDRPIEALLDLPRMIDPVACGTMDVLTALVAPAWHADPNLRSLVIGRAVNLSLEHGNSDASCYAYSVLSTVLGAVLRRVQGRIPIRPARPRPRGTRARPLQGPRVCERWEPCQSLDAAYPHGPSAAAAVASMPQIIGDITFAALSRTHLITNLLARRRYPLAKVQEETERA